MKTFYACALTFLYLILLMPSNVQAQGISDIDRMDSPKKVLPLQKTEKDSAIVLKQLIDTHMLFGSSIPSENLHQLTTFVKLNYGVKLTDPTPYRLYIKCLTYAKNKQYPEALAAGKAAVEEFDKYHEKAVGLLSFLRNIFSASNDWEDRLNYFTANIIGVKDNGIGISNDVKEKIMLPFFTTKPTGEGTGLGLSLTYDMVVKGHGGSITVDTKEGDFTEFKITLPLTS
jgi:hypothetical protein